MDKTATYSYRGSWRRQEVHRAWIQKRQQIMAFDDL